VIDEFAKEYLHDDLRWARSSLLAKLDGLGEYDVRRPLTMSGTNLLGLVKHLALSEARYFGTIFDRPYPEPIPNFDDPGFENRDHLWVTQAEARADITDRYRRACEHADATIDALPVDAPGYVPWWPRPDVKLFNVLVHVLTETNRHLGHADITDRYRRACEHADATIDALPVDAPGYVPWWPRPDVKLFNVLVHVLTETNRHLGHADILREGLDGAVGSDPIPSSSQDETDWARHRAKVERAARSAPSEH